MAQVHNSLFQLLLFAAVAGAVAASSAFGLVAAVVLSTALCAAALFLYWRSKGPDWRAAFLCAIFYALSWLFLSVKFWPGAFSLSTLPIVAGLALLAVAVFRLAVYNKSGEGKVVASAAGFVLVDVEPSPWHSCAGVVAVPCSEHFPANCRVLVRFAGGVFGPLRPRLAQRARFGTETK